MAKAEQLLAHRLVPGSNGLYDPANMPLLHHVNQGLRAHTLFRLDVDYMIKDGGVVIVDEFTGRLMPGRRWSDGLHQAVEAKEKVKIERENQTLATITFQNYFRKYKKLAGMTGTAETEAPEFNKIYSLDVIVVPTNRPMTRIEESDLVYRTERERTRRSSTTSSSVSPPAGRRWSARSPSRNQNACRPCSRSAASSTSSSTRSTTRRKRRSSRRPDARPTSRLPRTWRAAAPTSCSAATPSTWRASRHWRKKSRRSCPRARRSSSTTKTYVYFFHIDGFYRVPRKEWERIYSHFQKQTSTEHNDVVGVGGLHILGTERHEARRIDNQLRGRAGRQGDPGSSRFYLSLEDDLMRIFGSERISGLMQKLGMEEGVPIEHGMVTRAIERAQKQVEAQNFSVRKHLLEYDDVMNKQRESVYTLRREILEGKVHVTEDELVDTRGYMLALAEDIVDDLVDRYAGKEMDSEEWDVPALQREITRVFGFDDEELDALKFDEKNTEEIADAVWERAKANYEQKEQLVGADLLRRVERDIMLQIVDTQWKDHLYSLDHLKEGIGLRGYGQRDPLVEYKKESFALFQDMKARIEEEIVRYLFWLRPVLNDEAAPPKPAPRARHAHHDEQARGGACAGRGSSPGSVGGASRIRRRWRRRPAASPDRRRRRDQDRAPRGTEGRPQRPVSVRQR
jgi:preprotein translocase subunit SecA